jgi:hypothetical protein
MNGEVIKSFLVGLGFGVDETSLKKFNDSIKQASVRVTALYASIKVAAAGIFWSISKISEGFEQMGYEYRIIAPAINKALVLRRELLKAYAAAGINITKVVQQSVKFNMSLAKTQFALKAIYTSVGAKFFPLLTKQMDIFRGKIYANMPKIQASLEKFIFFIFKAFDGTIILGTRVWNVLSRIYDFFYKLHKATDGWSTIILAVVAAWKFLNLAFLATPLGMIITGILALIALYDDFMVWKEGGKSLIDWGSDTTRMIVGMVAAIAGLVAAFYAVQKGIVIFQALMTVLRAARIAMVAFSLVAALNPIGLMVTAAIALVGLLALLIIKWDVIKNSIGGFFAGMGDKILSFVGGMGDPAAGGGTAAKPQPLGSQVANNQQTNLHVQQQTQISVSGAADAQAVGKNVADQQGRVNFDMTRNMKGAVR